MRSSPPLPTSHTFSVWSSEAETARRPSAAHCDAMDSSGVAFQRAQDATALHIPHLQRRSSDAETAHFPSAVTATAMDSSKVALQRAQDATALHIPHLQRLVIRSGDRSPPVRRHRHATDRSRVAFQGAQLAPACPAPTPSACCHTRRRPHAARLGVTATPETAAEWPSRVRTSAVPGG